MNKHERDGRIWLLHQIAQWNLRANASWPQVRNIYTHIIRKIENQEISWDADWERYEKFIYDKVTTNAMKFEKKSRIRQKQETVWFCKAYQKIEGCNKDSPHPGRIGNQFKQMPHICAPCWLKEKIRRNHPECSLDCPNRDN